jgi:hypothetical protein
MKDLTATTATLLAIFGTMANALPTTRTGPTTDTLLTRRDGCDTGASIIDAWNEAGLRRYRIAWHANAPPATSDNPQLQWSIQNAWNANSPQSDCGSIDNNPQFYYNAKVGSNVIDVNEVIGFAGEAAANCMTQHLQRQLPKAACPSAPTLKARRSPNPAPAPEPSPAAAREVSLPSLPSSTFRVRRRDGCNTGASIVDQWDENGLRRYRVAWHAVNVDASKVPNLKLDVKGMWTSNNAASNCGAITNNMQSYYNAAAGSNVLDVSEVAGPVGAAVMACMAHNFQSDLANYACPP